MEARRFRAARLFAQGETQGAVARALGVTRVTAHHWYHAWKAHGRTALKAAGRAGRKPKLAAPQLAKVERALRAGRAPRGSVPICGRCRGWRRLSRASRRCAITPGMCGACCAG